MLVLATQNKNKIKEMTGLLGAVPWRAVDSSWSAAETAESLIGNALLKAAAARSQCQGNEISLADDTGLFVGALGGAPGVISARYAGANVAFEENIKKLLAEMKNLGPKERGAVFITVTALAYPDGRLVAGCGRIEGEILREPEGAGGFGYDPIFFCPALGKTLAQLTLEEKNSFSHRAQAVKTILPYIKQEEPRTASAGKIFNKGG